MIVECLRRYFSYVYENKDGAFHDFNIYIYIKETKIYFLKSIIQINFGKGFYS